MWTIIWITIIIIFIVALGKMVTEFNKNLKKE